LKNSQKSEKGLGLPINEMKSLLNPADWLESYRDEAQTVCQNCYVGGSAPQSQKDAFHNLLTGVVRHWMGEDYFGDWMVDRKHGAQRPDLDKFKHNQQPLFAPVMRKCSMTTTKLRLSKLVMPRKHDK